MAGRPWCHQSQDRLGESTFTHNTIEVLRRAFQGVGKREASPTNHCREPMVTREGTASQWATWGLLHGLWGMLYWHFWKALAEQRQTHTVEASVGYGYGLKVGCDSGCLACVPCSLVYLYLSCENWYLQIYSVLAPVSSLGLSQGYIYVVTVCRLSSPIYFGTVYRSTCKCCCSWKT